MENARPLIHPEEKPNNTMYLSHFPFPTISVEKFSFPIQELPTIGYTRATYAHRPQGGSGGGFSENFA